MYCGRLRTICSAHAHNAAAAGLIERNGPGTKDGLHKKGCSARILNLGISFAPEDLNVAILRKNTSVSAISRLKDDHMRSSGTVSPGDNKIITVADTRTTAGGGRVMDANATRFVLDKAADKSPSLISSDFVACLLRAAFI